MRAISWLPVLAALSCYRPELMAGQFKCDQPDDICPEGQVCQGGLCVKPGGGEDLMDTGGNPDLSGGGDGGGGDGMQGDPCAAGWIDITQNIALCRRMFNIAGGNYANLCRAGYHVCFGTEDLTALVASSTCNNTGGFFTTQLDIALRNPGDRKADGICSPQMTDTTRALLGCGTDSNLYQLNMTGCNGLKTALRCGFPPSNWACTSAKDVIHSSNVGGLLCCK